GNNTLNRVALVLLTRQEASWQEFINRVGADRPGTGMLTDPMLLDTYLQALGETGQRAKLLETYRTVETSIQGVPPSLMNLMRVKVAAFCGDDFIVAQLF